MIFWRRARWIGVFLGLGFTAFVVVRSWSGSDTSPPGSGEGSVHIGAPNSLVINQTAELGDLYPGAPAQTLSGTFTNTGAGAVFIGKVTAALTEITGASGPCSISNYELLNPVMTVERGIPVGVGVDAWSGASIRMIDEPNVQDNCQGATIHITYRAV